VTGDVSGDISLGYRHVSSVSLFSSGVGGMLQLISHPQKRALAKLRGYLQGRLASKQMLCGVLPKKGFRCNNSAKKRGCSKQIFPQVLRPLGPSQGMLSGPAVGGGMR